MPPSTRPILEQHYRDGAITNDKFCWVRRTQLRLSWSRLALCSRPAQSDVASAESLLPGGSDATSVERTPDQTAGTGRTAPVGPGLPGGAGLDRGGRQRRGARLPRGANTPVSVVSTCPENSGSWWRRFRPLSARNSGNVCKPDWRPTAALPSATKSPSLLVAESGKLRRLRAIVLG